MFAYARWAVKEVEDEVIYEDWKKLLQKVTTDGDYCNMHKSKDVIVFCEHYLGTNLIPERMKKLIR